MALYDTEREKRLQTDQVPEMPEPLTVEDEQTPQGSVTSVNLLTFSEGNVIDEGSGHARLLLPPIVQLSAQACAGRVNLYTSFLGDNPVAGWNNMRLLLAPGCIVPSDDFQTLMSTPIQLELNVNATFDPGNPTLGGLPTGRTLSQMWVDAGSQQFWLYLYLVYDGTSYGLFGSDVDPNGVVPYPTCFAVHRCIGAVPGLSASSVANFSQRDDIVNWYDSEFTGLIYNPETAQGATLDMETLVDDGQLVSCQSVVPPVIGRTAFLLVRFEVDKRDTNGRHNVKLYASLAKDVNNTGRRMIFNLYAFSSSGQVAIQANDYVEVDLIPSGTYERYFYLSAEQFFANRNTCECEIYAPSCRIDLKQ